MTQSKIPDSTVSSGSHIRTTGMVIGICSAVFIAATWLALKQPLRPDPIKPATIKEKFLFPYEENAFMRLPMVSGDLNDVFVVPKSGHIWAVGSDGLIIVSRDGGRSWERKSFPVQPQVPEPSRLNKKAAGLNQIQWGPRSVHAADPVKSIDEIKKAKLNVRQQAPVAKSSEKEQEKQIQLDMPKNPPETVPHLQSVFFVDESFGWIAGAGGTLLSTTDGGSTWLVKTSGTLADLYSIYFTDRDHGWACGADGTILSKSYGGRNWQVQPSGTDADYYSIYFSDRERGWACGSDGKILMTTDGGKSWQGQTIRTTADLFFIHFMDSERGWACGAYGTILSTTDGGRSWQIQISNTLFNLSEIRFLDQMRGWACGSSGMLLSTNDGGKSWQSQTIRTTADLFSIHFMDSERGWACGSYGTILSTTDSGRSWQVQTSSTTVGLSSIQFTDSDRGWACGRDGMILMTTDGGKSWQTQNNRTVVGLNDIQFIDSERGWACGSGGTILSTIDGGMSWQRQTWVPDIDYVDLNAIQFIDSERGWACGSGGTILSTIDGGIHWQSQDRVTIADLYSIQFMDHDRGWVIGLLGTTYSTTDGGKSWRHHQTRVDDFFYYSLYSIHFTDPERGWACGENGKILSTTDSGASWQGQISGISTKLLSIHFADRRHGWACGTGGTVLSTTDGGDIWKVQSSGTDASLTSIYFTNPKRGWVSGAGGTILSTADGGRTWNFPAYRRLPALWYWALCLSLILVSLFVVQRRGQPETAGETVADLLASDRPLEAGDPDPLDLHSISSGLARFIANRNTDPPLTIAVTGEWGTGKSSLMNLLYHDLKQRRFQPVWFNAWHHQKGEQLLASLYANIRQQAVPPLWHPSGILFRLRLLFQRGRRNRLAFGALAFLLFAAYPFLENVILSIAGGMIALVKALIARDMDSVRQLFSFTDVNAFIPDNWIGALLASPAVAAVWKAIRAFGLSPQSLLAFGSADGGKRRGLDPGARARFAREFQDVASSLDLGAMVIFIDDLDRCSKENVVEILETINFLAVSGRCFIILGMARQWVETCVALQFKELAEETGNEKNSRDDGYVHRRRFAKQYLEKLINIEVPVPVPSPDAARALLRPNTPDPTSRMEQILSTLGKAAKKYAPVVCLVGLALLAWYLKDIFKAEPRQVREKPNQELMVLPASSQKGELVLQDGSIRIPLNDIAGPPGGADGRSLEIVLKGQEKELETGIAIGTLGSDEQSAEVVLRYKPKAVEKTTQQPADAPIKQRPRVQEDKQREEASFRPGAEDTSRTGHWLAMLVGLGLVAIGVLYLIQRPQRFTADSKTFRDALDIWHPWIVLVRRTPRTIKRFLNRLRYVAMRLRSEPERLSLLERMKNRIIWKQSVDKTVKTSEGVPEPVLVALGAIYHVNPDWVTNADTLGELFSTNTEGLIQPLETLFTESTENSERIIDTAVELTNAIAKYKNEFGQDLEDLIRHRDAFLSVLAETGM